MKVVYSTLETPIEGKTDRMSQSFSDSKSSKLSMLVFIMDVLPFITGRIMRALGNRRSHDSGKHLKSRTMIIKIKYGN